jgi:hypothetical protein
VEWGEGGNEAEIAGKWGENVNGEHKRAAGEYPSLGRGVYGPDAEIGRASALLWGLRQDQPGRGEEGMMNNRTDATQFFGQDQALREVDDLKFAVASQGKLEMCGWPYSPPPPEVAALLNRIGKGM